jgi:hypothetical protein
MTPRFIYLEPNVAVRCDAITIVSQTKHKSAEQWYVNVNLSRDYGVTLKYDSEAEAKKVFDEIMGHISGASK